MEPEPINDEILGQVRFRERDHVLGADEWETSDSATVPSVQVEFIVNRDESPASLIPVAQRVLNNLIANWETIRQDAAKTVCRIWNSQLNRPKDDRVTEAQMLGAIHAPQIAIDISEGQLEINVYLSLDWPTDDVIVIPVDAQGRFGRAFLED
jgi:hypothetical protein